MNTLWNIHDVLVYKNTDPRFTRMPLVGTPYPLLIILTIYWLIVKNGPKLMANRPAYNIKNVIQFYNILQIIINGVIASWCGYMMAQKSFRCLTYRTDSAYDLTFVFFSWAYAMQKFVDLFDTLFFVLRKKFHLLTTLHVYHHILMASASVIIARYYPAGELAVMGVVNSFVHTIMYFYYFYCLHTANKQSLWWKKYITQLQLTQFVLFVVYYTYKLFQTDCDYPKGLIIFCLTQALTMLCMFSNYYYNAFIRSKDPVNITKTKTS